VRSGERVKRPRDQGSKGPSGRGAERDRRWIVGILGACMTVGVSMRVSVALAQDATGSQKHTIVAGAYVGADGQLVAGPVRVIVQGGKIISIEPGAGAPAGQDISVDEYPGAVVCPGLIDCNAALGVLGGLNERQTAIQPRVDARDAFNRFSPQLRAALAGGVTTFAIAPDDQNLVGGRMAICQTSGPGGQPQLILDVTDGARAEARGNAAASLGVRGPLKLSLDPQSFKVDREPTSRSGAIGMFRDMLEAARRGEKLDASLADFAAGKLTGVLTAPSGADVLSALELSREYKLRLVLIHASDAREVAELATDSLAGVIVGPFDWSAGQREAAAARLFASRGLKVAIAGGLPWTSADSLRIGAAVATRAGLAPEVARRAITTVPAELLGVSEQVGSLAAGHRADVVVFSGDPLDLRSRVLAVYVGGKRVYVPTVATGTGVVP
jgi:imidazolonepropionase-like amidohydrolase